MLISYDAPSIVRVVRRHAHHTGDADMAPESTSGSIEPAPDRSFGRGREV
jgi:hypothetical protein